MIKVYSSLLALEGALNSFHFGSFGHQAGLSSAFPYTLVAEQSLVAADNEGSVYFCISYEINIPTKY